jgi:membrane associated rhomboid family serine protease
MNAWQDGPGGRPQLQFAWPPLTPVVKRLIVANITLFFTVFLSGLVSLEFRAGVMDLLAIDPAAWYAWFPLLPLWQLVSYGFVHSVDGIGHLFFNMLMLYVFGGMLESALGGRRFVVFYFASLVLAGLVHVLVMPLFGSYAPAIGASGACLAVTVAMAMLRPNATIYVLVFPVPLKYLAGFLVFLDLFQVLSQMMGAQGDGKAVYVHLGGALYGFLAVRFGWIHADPVASFQRKRAVEREVARMSDDARMDQLLDRIKREGLGSLTSAEREFLKRQSERGR